MNKKAVRDMVMMVAELALVFASLVGFAAAAFGAWNGDGRAVCTGLVLAVLVGITSATAHDVYAARGKSSGVPMDYFDSALRKAAVEWNRKNGYAKEEGDEEDHSGKEV